MTTPNTSVAGLSLSKVASTINQTISFLFDPLFHRASRICSRYRQWSKGSQVTSNPSPAKPPAPLVTQSNSQLLAHKNVLIAGVGKNIGQALAIEMAKQGANLFFVDIDPQTCQNLESVLQSEGVTARGYTADISDTNSIDALCQTLKQQGIVIDILVNNVGVQCNAIGLQTTTMSQWQQTFNTNVIGPVYLTQQLTQAMIQHQVNGCIIFTSSIHQFIVSRWPSYSASKAALGMVIEELAVDLAGHGIRVNGIAPGWVEEDAEGNTLNHPYTPLGKSSISPTYIGRAAVYLAADFFSQHTTGTVLKIDGGLSLYNARVAQEPPTSSL